MTSDRDPQNPAPPDDPLHRLAALDLPAPDPAVMRADIARARERFIAAGLHAAAPPSRLQRWFSPLRLGLAGSSATACAMAALLLLPSDQGPSTGIPERSDFNSTARGGTLADDPAALADNAPMPEEAPAPLAPPASKKSAAAAPRDVTIVEPPLPAPDFPSMAAVPPTAGGNTAAGSAYEPAAEALASAAPAAPSNSLPRLGARPRSARGDTALVDLDLPEEEAELTDTLAFSLSGDAEGIYLDRDAGRLAIPIWETAPGMTLQMTDAYLLPARGGFPQILMIKGRSGDQEPWQIFRVGEDEVSFDRVITDLVKAARSPGQVQAMLNRLPPPD